MHEQIKNSPISYDFHGDLAIEKPFEELEPKDIDLYLDLDTYIGKDTCGQACNHCWFVNNRAVMHRRFDPAEGVAIYRALQAHGFKVFPRYTDSFAYQGELMKHYSTANARTYYTAESALPTETMQKGEAWTSGQPLLGSGHEALLDIARENHFGTITMTFHGLIREDLSLEDAGRYPVKGVFGAREFEQVVANIQAYNRKHAASGFEGFKVGVGITLGSHNHEGSMLERYFRYFNRLGVHRVRFNNFFDHGERHPQLVLSQEQLAEVYRNLSRLHASMPLGFQLGVSEDLGTHGIEALGLPGNAGWCRAGKQLFAIIPVSGERKRWHDSGNDYRVVGELVGCVNIFEPLLGQLVERKPRDAERSEYYLHFDVAAIEDLMRKRVSKQYRNGCFARELLDEVMAERPSLVVSP